MKKSEKYSCLMFGEGGRDKNFLQALIEVKQFKHHTSKWVFNLDNASGGSAETILEKCKKTASNAKYDLILCFIDLDDLKHRTPKSWEKQKQKFEEEYPEISIIWQIDNAEDEYKRILGERRKSKQALNKLAKEKVDKFVNSGFWKRIMSPIIDKEKKLKR